MKSPLFAILVLSCSMQLLPAQESPEETVVRNAYAKLAFQCGLSPLTDAAVKETIFTSADQVSVKAEIAKATPIFDLSDFTTGSIENISDQKWLSFVTLPTKNDSVLEGGMISHQYGDVDANAHYSWRAATLHWAPGKAPDPEAEANVAAWTVGDAIKLGSPQWTEIPARYTRYVAFTVDATLHGKSTGPHKAIFLFGTDKKGNEVVVPADFFSALQANWDLLRGPSYPGGLLQSNLRDNPVVATWIRDNTVPAALCPNTQRDLCCSRGRCGLSQTDVERELSTPVQHTAIN